MFGIRWGSQVNPWKLHLLSDLENTTTATSNHLAGTGQRFTCNYSDYYVCVCGCVCLCKVYGDCQLACVGGDKAKRFSCWCTHAWKHSTVQALWDIKSARDACVHMKHVCAHMRVGGSAQTRTRGLRFVGQRVENALTTRISRISL